MRSAVGFLTVVFFGLWAIGGARHSLAKGPPPDAPELTASYYPPPESAGGWRRCKNDKEVRELAAMDPQKLDLVGRENTVLFGGPWALLVVRHGYIAAEWMGVPAMPQTTFDVWSCTKSATGIACGLLLDDSRNHRLPTDGQIDLDRHAIRTSPRANHSPIQPKKRSESAIC
jgi:hypothetical protein